MGAVDYHLRVRRIMQSCDCSTRNANFVMQHTYDGRQAIRRARRSCDHFVFRKLNAVMIHTEDQVGGSNDWVRDEDLLGKVLEVRHAVASATQATAAFNHKINAKILPR